MAVRSIDGKEKKKKSLDVFGVPDQAVISVQGSKLVLWKVIKQQSRPDKLR